MLRCPRFASGLLLTFNDIRHTLECDPVIPIQRNREDFQSPAVLEIAAEHSANGIEEVAHAAPFHDAG